MRPETHITCRAHPRGPFALREHFGRVAVWCITCDAPRGPSVWSREVPFRVRPGRLSVQAEMFRDRSPSGQRVTAGSVDLGRWVDRQGAGRG